MGHAMSSNGKNASVNGHAMDQRASPTGSMMDYDDANGDDANADAESTTSAVTTSAMKVAKKPAAISTKEPSMKPPKILTSPRVSTVTMTRGKLTLFR